MSVAVVQVSAVAGRVSRGRRHGGLRREILTGLLRSAVPGRRRVSETTQCEYCRRDYYQINVVCEAVIKGKGAYT